MRASIACPSIASAACARRQRLARGDAQLPLDQVEAGDHLGDRMLDLQPRVHLHEIERAVLLGDELDGAGADIADRLGRGRRGVAHRAPAGLVHSGRRRLLEHFLMPPLHASNRARTGARRCRACRRTPGSRCAAARADSVRSASGRRRTTPSPRAAPTRARPQTPPRCAATFIPLPPPPAVALISTGKPMRAASRASSAGSWSSS